MLEVVLELGAFALFAGAHAGTEGGVLLEQAAQLVDQRGVFGETLHQDIARAFQRGFYIGHALLGIHKTGGEGFRVLRRVIEQAVGQWAEAGFQGDLALGATLGFVGQVEVFEAGFGVRAVDLAG